MRRAALGLLLAGAALAADADAEPSVAAAAHRLLAQRCVSCHGPDRVDAGIRLDRSSDIALVITPRKPDSSHLIRVLGLQAGDPLLMPPPAAGPRLTPAEVALLRRWIAEGADPPPPPAP